MTGEQLEKLEALVKPVLDQPFIANPGPQTEALLSEADILLYGGAAGGGKTALEVGCAALGHQSGIILRREATQLDGIIEFSKEVLGGRGNYNKVEKVWEFDKGRILKFAGLNQPDDWRKYAGIARDYMAFDEAGEFLKEQVFSLIGWLRSTKEGQRCRVILGSNPPRGGEGEWMIEEFAPWLDDAFPNPAKDGELRWAIVVGGETEWVDGPGVYIRDDQEYTAMSRTFIPAMLDDNPYLKDTNYRAVLQGLPEPLRSQLLNGDFLAGREDHEWQVIPTKWVEAAMDRWTEGKRQMLALSADIALGGKDDIIIGALHDGNHFAEMKAHQGVDVTDPKDIANLMIAERRDGADLSVDLTGGWGSGVKSHIENSHAEIKCHGIVFSSGPTAPTKDKRFKFLNLRAQMFWQFREALDPMSEEDIALPPDKRLKAELTQPRWELRKDVIKIESKEDIRKRLGRSTDRADVAVMLWNRRFPAIRKAMAHVQQGVTSAPMRDPLEGF